jgi:membrane fusion protein, multidrug efflux system
MRLTVVTLVISCCLGISAHAQQGQPSAAPVRTVYAERKPIARTLEFVGRVEAIERVEVKARVTGYLDAVLFKEGDLVKVGDPIYRIEKGLFEAAVTQAQGALERAKAQKILTAVELQRAENLLAQRAGSVADRDRTLAADKQADAAIMTAEADLATAKINLGYTDIVSPIAGKIGKTNITKGNVVGPSSGVLTTIVSQDPMYATFPVSQREFLRRQQTGNGPNVQSIKVKLRYSDGTFYDQLGVINFVDVSVDRATDTVTVRATVPNPKNGLIDGQLVRVVLEAGEPEEKIVIPQSALIADQEGIYVFVVEDGKAAVKRVKPGDTEGTGTIIASGLSGGEQVIVEGLQALRPGVPVMATPLPPPTSNPS